jgi:hypothetical protein
LCITITVTLFTLGGTLRAEAQARLREQTPAENYLTLRKSYPPKPGVTPATISANPSAHQNTTLELEGRLSGIVRSEGQSAFLILATDKYGSITVKMSLVPNWIQPSARLRALVIVPEAEPGTVSVGTPNLEVVAVALASEVQSAENKAKQEAALLAERERKRQAVTQAKAMEQIRIRNAPRASYASRGSFTRGLSHRNVHVGNVVSLLSPDALAVLTHYQEFIQKWNKRLSEGEVQVIAASILLFCGEYDVDPRLVVAMVCAESDFRPQTTSHKGAMGLGQLMPDEVKELGITDPYDLVQNIFGAVHLLKGRLDKYSGGAAREDLQMRHIILALASYNAGMGAVKKYGGVPPYRETQNYVKKIERLYRELCGEEAPR